MPVPSSISDLSQTAGNNYPTGAESPTTADDYFRAHAAFIAQMRDGAIQYVGSISGTNTITGSTSPATTAYVAGQTYKFVAAATNTGAVTLNVNSVGAMAITQDGSYPLFPGQIIAGAVVEVIYDGTQFQLTNQLTASLCGMLGFFPTSAAPDGWVKLNNGTIGSASSGASRANADTLRLYTLLWNNLNNTVATIQTSAGAPTTRGASAAADFAANKRMPVTDMRGESVRAWDDSRGVDTSRVLGSAQLDAIQNIQGTMEVLRLSGGETLINAASGAFGRTTATGAAAPRINIGVGTSLNTDTVAFNAAASSGARTATETRMRNVAWLACIHL